MRLHRGLLIAALLASVPALAAEAAPDAKAAPAKPAAKPAARPKAAPKPKKVSKEPKKPSGPMRPVNIQSSSFEVLGGAKQAVWKGNVVADRDDLKLHCDTLTADYDDQKRIKSLTCVGNVHMVQKTAAIDREAWGERAYYDNQRAMLELTGNPRMRDGQNDMRGEKFTIFQTENRVAVEKPVMNLETKGAAEELKK